MTYTLPPPARVSLSANFLPCAFSVFDRNVGYHDVRRSLTEERAPSAVCFAAQAEAMERERRRVQMRRKAQVGKPRNDQGGARARHGMERESTHNKRLDPPAVYPIVHTMSPHYMHVTVYRWASAPNRVGPVAIKILKSPRGHSRTAITAGIPRTFIAEAPLLPSAPHYLASRDIASLETSTHQVKRAWASDYEDKEDTHEGGVARGELTRGLSLDDPTRRRRPVFRC